MCSGSEAGSYLRLIDFVYHSTLVLRVINNKKIQFYQIQFDQIQFDKTQFDQIQFDKIQLESPFCAILRVDFAFLTRYSCTIQGYLAHEKLPPPRTLQ